jgi:uncharacterized protein YeaO (DUF488 family)
MYILEILNNPLASKALDNLASLDRTNNSDTNHEGQHQQQQPPSQRPDILLKYDTVTLLCHCKDENHCHRFLVKCMMTWVRI